MPATSEPESVTKAFLGLEFTTCNPPEGKAIILGGAQFSNDSEAYFCNYSEVVSVLQVAQPYAALHFLNCVPDGWQGDCYFAFEKDRCELVAP